MVPHIPAPIQGQPLKSSWGAAVAESCNAMRQIGARGLVRSGPFGLGEAALPHNLRNRHTSTLLHPFKVRCYFRESNKDSPYWAIHLPPGPVVNIDGNIYDVTANLTPSDALSPGWYNLDMIPSIGGTVWLNISKGSNDSAKTVAFAAEASGDRSFAIASVSYSHNNATIYQYILSSIIIGGTTAGSDITVDSTSAVAVDLSYVKPSESDFSEHPYAIRLRRGRLVLQGGILGIQPDDSMTQYIDTTPHSDIIGGTT